MAVAAIEQEQIWFLDGLVTVHAAHASASNGISVLEVSVPYGSSPPLHIHHTEDEIFHVLEGRLRLRVDGSDVYVGPGETALAPLGVPHTYRVESGDGARGLVITARGDFERFVRAVGRPAEQSARPGLSGPPTPEQVEALAATAAKHGIDLIGPPLEG
jgi:mannose-6-phosphate isomerase-like protein (cupin superfamily)